ncbi:MAG: ABC transporter permease [Eubacteriales bacterium]|nr:ABC transporter permease [Eubacteriales bacterium]
MKTEIKICLPVYKIVYSVLFMILLSLVRGISFVHEIGIAMQVYVGLLALIFCADTYETEFQGHRFEVLALRPLAGRVKAIRRRLLIQFIYLCILSSVGYVCFYWQSPQSDDSMNPLGLYGIYMAAAAVMVLFWGILSMTLVSVGHNLWTGIGIALLLWMALNSSWGDSALGKWNIFAFTYRDVTDMGNYSWLLGTGIALLLSVIMAAAIPWTIKKRGMGI